MTAEGEGGSRGGAGARRDIGKEYAEQKKGGAGSGRVGGSYLAARPTDAGDAKSGGRCVTLRFAQLAELLRNKSIGIGDLPWSCFYAEWLCSLRFWSFSRRSLVRRRLQWTW